MNDEWNRRYVVSRLLAVAEELYALRVNSPTKDALKQRERNALAQLQMKAKELADKIEETK